MLALLRRLTVEQWAAIDEEYVDRSRPAYEAIAVLLFVAAGLILARYYGRVSYIRSIRWYATWILQLPQYELYLHLYWACFKLINYGLLPVLCIRFVLRGRIVEHGLRPHAGERVWRLYWAMLLCMLPIVYGASLSDAFLRTYPKYRGAGDSLWGLVAWELAYCMQFFLLEFFFRGFMIFALARRVGSLAIFVMVVPYAMIHFGKPFMECVGSVFAGIVLGTIALRTGSIYGGVMVHCGVGVGMDLFALHRQGLLVKLLT